MMHPDRKVFTMLKYKRYQPTHDKLMMISDETNISIQNQRPKMMTIPGYCKAYDDKHKTSCRKILFNFFLRLFCFVQYVPAHQQYKLIHVYWKQLTDTTPFTFQNIKKKNVLVRQMVNIVNEYNNTFINP